MESITAETKVRGACLIEETIRLVQFHDWTPKRPFRTPKRPLKIPSERALGRAWLVWLNSRLFFSPLVSGNYLLLFSQGEWLFLGICDSFSFNNSSCLISVIQTRTRTNSSLWSNWLRRERKGIYFKHSFWKIENIIYPSFKNPNILACAVLAKKVRFFNHWNEGIKLFTVDRRPIDPPAVIVCFYHHKPLLIQ